MKFGMDLNDVHLLIAAAAAVAAVTAAAAELCFHSSHEICPRDSENVVLHIT